MRLVDADKLPKYTGYALSASKVAMAVENAPTVDAVPVVRCRECIHNYANMVPGGEGCAKCTELPIAPDFFCKSGERKEEEDE